MHFRSSLAWVLVAVCLWFAPGGLHGADVAEVREYLTRAQARLAEHDPVSVDNLLHLAEAALEDLPPADQQALQVEISALRNQWENDTEARRAALAEKRLEALFSEAELTLGAVQAGGRSTLKAIEQILSDPATLSDLGRDHLDKYRRRLSLFERAHARKLAARGLLPTVEATEGSTDSLPAAVVRPVPSSVAVNPPVTVTNPATSGQATSGSPPLQSIELGHDDSDRQNSRPVWQITLFGNSGSRVGLFTVLWRLMLTAGAVLVVLTKLGVRGVRTIPRVGQICDSIELVPMPMWGLLMAAVGLWWLLNGWIVWGLLPSLAMLALAGFTIIDIAERLGWVGPAAADLVRRMGFPIAVTALGIALLHVVLRGAWIVV